MNASYNVQGYGVKMGSSERFISLLYSTAGLDPDKIIKNTHFKDVLTKLISYIIEMRFAFKSLSCFESNWSVTPPPTTIVGNSSPYSKIKGIVDHIKL